jgi:hypothetical protein
VNIFDADVVGQRSLKPTKTGTGKVQRIDDGPIFENQMIGEDTHGQICRQNDESFTKGQADTETFVFVGVGKVWV